MKPLLDFAIRRFEVLESTNTTACELAKDGAPEGTVVLAGRQTGGRGRFGRSFFSPEGTGLYFSIILRPTAQPLYLTTAAAVAVAQAAEAVTGKPMGIKWVNDVYCNGQKVCGILTEGGFANGKLDYAVLGIGINVAPPAEGFPAELAGKAGALWDTPVAAEAVESLLNEILCRFAKSYTALEKKPFLEAYRRLSLLDGKTVELLAPDGRILEQATVEGIGDEFELLVRGSDGNPRALSSGEVSIKL